MLINGACRTHQWWLRCLTCGSGHKTLSFLHDGTELNNSTVCYNYCFKRWDKFLDSASVRCWQKDCCPRLTLIYFKWKTPLYVCTNLRPMYCLSFFSPGVFYVKREAPTSFTLQSLSSNLSLWAYHYCNDKVRLYTLAVCVCVCFITWEHICVKKLRDHTHTHTDACAHTYTRTENRESHHHEVRLTQGQPEP